MVICEILNAAFELSDGRVVTRVYVTTTGDKVYGFPREQDKGVYIHCVFILMFKLQYCSS